ncbi:MAG: RusA family crossover junction endodeoxyribonuclease [Pseudomonadota bacterium]
MQIKLEVAGRPAPKGSSRAFVIPGTNRAVVAPSGSAQNKANLKSWDQSVRLAANEAVRAAPPGSVYPGGGPIFVDVPLRIAIVFRLARPSGHWRKAGGLKPSAPAFPATKPDFDKLTRATCDSLKGTIYDDDSRIVSSSIDKVYAAPGEEGASIIIEPR